MALLSKQRFLDTLSPLARAIHDQKPLPHLQRLIREGADVNQNVMGYPYRHYNTPLLEFTVYHYQPSKIRCHKVTRHFQYLRQVLDLLLEHGADPSCFAPLHDHLIPFLYDDPELLASLIKGGLLIHLVNDRGETVLIQSVKRLRIWIRDPIQVRQRCAVIEQLLDHGMEPNLQDEGGSTALHHLLVCPLLPELFPLLQRLVSVTDVRLEDNDGNTALHDYYVTYKEETTPIADSALIPYQTVIDLLLEHGGDPNARNEQGDTPGERRERDSMTIR